MDRETRIRRTLQVLRSEPATPIHEMAARFGVSERTVYRDLHAIRSGVTVKRKSRVGYHVEVAQ